MRVTEALWLSICGASVGAGVMVAVHLWNAGPVPWTPSGYHSIPFYAASVLAALCGLGGMLSATLHAADRRRLGSALRENRQLLNHRTEIERQAQDLRRRIDELSTLREVAYVVNRETDFDIIAEKVLDLVAGLFEPRTVIIYLLRDEASDQDLQPFCVWEQGKTLFGKRIKLKDIPNLALTLFDRYGVMVRRFQSQIYVIIPLKVETEVLGVMLMVFSPPAESAERRMKELGETKRVLLHEIAQHISLALKAKHLRTKAVVDGLTRLYTKGHFLEQLDAHIDMALRSGDALSLIAIDIDHFKRVNDTYGHLTGDIVLAEVAARLKKSLRKYDSAYRYGGEELTIILPKTPAAKAAQIAERIRSRIEKARMTGEKGEKLGVTISLGVADVVQGDTPETLIGRADECLYDAKHAGRNCVVVCRAGPEPAVKAKAGG